jgi:hypothetical protein
MTEILMQASKNNHFNKACNTVELGVKTLLKASDTYDENSSKLWRYPVVRGRALYQCKLIFNTKAKGIMPIG